jgi:hypothetical protein
MAELNDLGITNSSLGKSGGILEQHEAQPNRLCAGKTPPAEGLLRSKSVAGSRGTGISLKERFAL